MNNDYSNIFFTDKLPYEGSTEKVHIDELKQLKDSIDVKLKKLENKFKMKTFLANIVQEEKQPEFIKKGVSFGPANY